MGAESLSEYHDIPILAIILHISRTCLVDVIVNLFIFIDM